MDKSNFIKRFWWVIAKGYAALKINRAMKELQIGNIRVIFDQAQAAKSFDAVAVVLFSSGRLVFVRNKERAWEFPGGHREGNESYEETAAREANEEAQVKITDIEYLGYYISPTEHTTVIVVAEVSSFLEFDGEYETSEVGIFDRLPFPLSFGDGREQLFIDHAARCRANRRIYSA